MRGKRTLGETLRGILLATQFAGASACCASRAFQDGGPNSGADAGPDAGIAVSDCKGLLLEVPDGGFPAGGCMAICDSLQTGTYDCEVNYMRPSMFCCCCEAGSCCNTGRRPASLLGARQRIQANVLGRHFREASRLEAASVEAFRVLGLELRAHDAPERLRRGARRAARDELRHARSTGALARRFGAEPETPRYGAPPPVRSIEALALENAVEGCARETYGALVGLWQAKHAGDPAVGRAMKSIAEDEVRHAELAWDVARWAEQRLTASARALIGKARTGAFDQLEREAAAPMAVSLVTSAGLPSPAIATQLARAVHAALS